MKTTGKQIGGIQPPAWLREDSKLKLYVIWGCYKANASSEISTSEIQVDTHLTLN